MRLNLLLAIFTVFLLQSNSQTLTCPTGSSLCSSGKMALAAVITPFPKNVLMGVYVQPHKVFAQ